MNAAFVFIYDYEYWDAETKQMKLSVSPAPMEVIKNGLGIPILRSQRKVPAADLDEFGRFKAQVVGDSGT